MLLQLIIALLIGLIAGTFTGLIPGIHINLIAVFLLSLSTALLKITEPITLVIFITSMTITHTFIDYIPSIFLGAPDEDSILSVLPGHRFLLKGRAYHAVILTLYGSLTALLIILIFIPIFLYLLPIIYPYIKKIMWIILILVSMFLITSEKDKKIWALIIFLIAGFLGIATLNFPIQQPLLPLLTGLFGASNLFISINQNTKIPFQKITKLTNIRLSKSSLAKSSFASIIAAPFTAFLPGLGASQAALISKQVFGKNQIDSKEFLFILGAINTIVAALAIIAYYSLNITRTGAVITISQILPTLTKTHLFLIISTIIISGILSFVLAVNLSKLTATYITKIPYKTLSAIILTLLILVTFILSDMFNLTGGLFGLLILLISTCLGIFTILLGIKRMHLMGCLLIPTILFYLL